MKIKILFLFAFIVLFSLVGCNDNKEFGTDIQTENKTDDVISTQNGKLFYPNAKIAGFEEEDYLTICEDVKRIDEKYNGLNDFEPISWNLCDRISKVKNGSYSFYEVSISNNVLYIAGYHESYIGGDIENADEIIYVISDNLEELNKTFDGLGRCSLYTIYSVNSVKDLLGSDSSDNNAFYYASCLNKINDLRGNYLMCLKKSDLNNYGHFVLEEEIYPNRCEIFEQENNKFIKLEMEEERLEYEFEGYEELRNILEKESDFYKLDLAVFFDFLKK